MDWREQMGRGAFRGVPFNTNSFETIIAHRIAVHDYPKRGKGWPEYMGPSLDGFTFECYVSGSDYMEQRDNLDAALSEEGPGKLINPFGGQELTIQVVDARILQRSGEEGVARFVITYIEAGDNSLPDGQTDTASMLDLKADNALSALATDFAASFGVKGFPQFVTDEAEAVIQDGTNILARLQSFSADEVDLSIINTTQSPAEMADSVIEAIKHVDDVVDLRKLADYGIDLPPVVETTRTRVRQAANQAAALRLINTTAVIEMTRSLVRV